MEIRHLQNYLKKGKIDLVLLLNLDSMCCNPRLFYFTGYRGIGAFLIPKNKKSFLMVPKMELERAKKHFKNAHVLEKKKLFESVKKVLKRKKIKIKTLGIDFQSINVSTFRLIKKELKKTGIKDISKELLDIRKIKSAEEIRKLKKVCSLTDKILQKCLKNFKKFKTEADVASFLEYETKKISCDLSFPPIVASGRNSSIPHYEPQNTKLKKGFCVIDFGVKYRGYCSDITRTIYIGKPKEKEKEIYNFLLKVQNNSIKSIKEGSECGKIYMGCIKQLGKHAKYFTHGLGHGVGVEVHELPNLTLNSEDKLEKNMAFTIEPGIYIPGKFGIRIEDTVLMKNKPVVLTKTPKGLNIIN